MISSNRNFQMQCNHNYFHDYTLFTMLYHARDMFWYVREKLTIELINPLMDCCHIILIHMMICQLICSMNMKGKYVETLLQMLLLF